MLRQSADCGTGRREFDWQVMQAATTAMAIRRPFEPEFATESVPADDLHFAGDLPVVGGAIFAGNDAGADIEDKAGLDTGMFFPDNDATSVPFPFGVLND